MEPKAPLVSALDRYRRLGCEYECTLPLIGSGDADARRVIAEILTSNGVPSVARGYSHEPLPAGIDVAVENDSSVRGETVYQGIRWVSVEVKTRILSGPDDWERVVPKMLSILNYLGCRVNASTGHHVHVEVSEVQGRPEIARSLVNVFARFENVLLGCVAPSRRDNHYCRSIADQAAKFARVNCREDLNRVLAGIDRHRTINLQHIGTDSPRVEVRMHQGTLDVDKARYWMRLCLALVGHACRRNCKAAKTPLTDDRKSMEKMLVTLGLKPNSRVYIKVDPELRATGRYLLRRWGHFHRGGSSQQPSV